MIMNNCFLLDSPNVGRQFQSVSFTGEMKSAAHYTTLVSASYLMYSQLWWLISNQALTFLLCACLKCLFAIKKIEEEDAVIKKKMSGLAHYTIGILH